MNEHAISPQGQQAAAVGRTDDERHLDLLAIFHYVLGGIMAFFGCCPVMHLVMGVSMMFGLMPGPGPHPAFHLRSHQEVQSREYLEMRSRLDELKREHESQQQPEAGSDALTPQPQKPKPLPPSIDAPPPPHMQHSVSPGWSHGMSSSGRRFEAGFGLVVTLMSLAMMLTAWAMAVAMIIAGRGLKQRTKYTYCLVVAGISCIFMPLGTVLGVFTIVVLTRPGVKALFEANQLASNQIAADQSGE